MKNEIWLKEREREEKIMSRFFFWAHNEKQRGDAKNKGSKTLKKEPFLKKLPTKEIDKHIIFDEKTWKRDFHFFEKEL